MAERDAKHWSGMPQGFWSYESADPGAPPEGMSDKAWFSLSPGMRREVKREAERRAKLRAALIAE